MVMYLKNLCSALLGKTKPEQSRSEFIVSQELLDSPWAMFEIVGFENNGRVKVEFNWNAPFIKKLDEFGFTAETEEETVQLFFYTSQLTPLNGSGDPTVQSADLPLLSANSNRVVQ